MRITIYSREKCKIHKLLMFIKFVNLELRAQKTRVGKLKKKAIIYLCELCELSKTFVGVQLCAETGLGGLAGWYAKASSNVGPLCKHAKSMIS